MHKIAQTMDEMERIEQSCSNQNFAKLQLVMVLKFLNKKNLKLHLLPQSKG